MDYKQILYLLHKLYPELSKEHIEKIVLSFFKVIADAIKTNQKVEIRKFGIFRLKTVKEREIYLPRFDKYVKKNKSFLPHFKNTMLL